MFIIIYSLLFWWPWTHRIRPILVPLILLPHTILPHYFYNSYIPLFLLPVYYYTVPSIIILFHSIIFPFRTICPPFILPSIPLSPFPFHCILHCPIILFNGRLPDIWPDDLRYWLCNPFLWRWFTWNCCVTTFPFVFEPWNKMTPSTVTWACWLLPWYLTGVCSWLTYYWLLNDCYLFWLWPFQFNRSPLLVRVVVSLFVFTIVNFHCLMTLFPLFFYSIVIDVTTDVRLLLPMLAVSMAGQPLDPSWLWPTAVLWPSLWIIHAILAYCVAAWPVSG